MPFVPLYRLLAHPKVRPIQDRVKQLENEFEGNGYSQLKGNFVISLDAPNGYPIVEVTAKMKSKWSLKWQELNATFEKELLCSEWRDMSQKMFYVWDENHRLKA